VLAGAGRQHAAQLDQAELQGGGRLTQPQCQVGGDQVVAAAARVQARRRLADPFAQARLHVHVDVLEGRVEDEAPARDLGLDGIEARQDGVAIGVGDEPLGGQHARMGARGAQVLARERPVEVDRGAEALDRGIRRLGKPPAPGLLRGHRVQISGIVVDFQGRP